MSDTHDPVNHPKHYTSHPSGVECIQVTRHMSFNLGNVIKYLWRAEEKGAPLEDLKKARWYLDDEIMRREAELPAVGVDQVTAQRMRETAAELDKKGTGFAAPQPDADGWIEWHGGECPVPADALVIIRLRDNNESVKPEHAEGWHWRHSGGGGDIVAYRVVK